jgi:hypothetical protein
MTTHCRPESTGTIGQAPSRAVPNHQSEREPTTRGARGPFGRVPGPNPGRRAGRPISRSSPARHGRQGGAGRRRLGDRRLRRSDRRTLRCQNSPSEGGESRSLASMNSSRKYRARASPPKAPTGELPRSGARRGDPQRRSFPRRARGVRGASRTAQAPRTETSEQLRRAPNRHAQAHATTQPEYAPIESTSYEPSGGVGRVPAELDAGAPGKDRPRTAQPRIPNQQNCWTNGSTWRRRESSHFPPSPGSVR